VDPLYSVVSKIKCIVIAYDIKNNKILKFLESKIKTSIVRFQVLTAASMKFRAFWDVLPCNQIDVDRRFRGMYCLPSSGQ
jgi:hypothetical protein